jgi:AraC family transcriptional regulator of adaptative response/methylated-DNA-[protein]-cysteine methyltransferase
MTARNPGRFMTDEKRWAAVAARDQAAAEAFVYAVTTTGVFCRPGCSFRLPRRAHVVFFDGPAAARAAGYRPCRRCRPEEPFLRSRHADRIARACRRIERAEATQSLEKLARDVSLSPYHFHRLFKAIVGVTPKQYATACRLGRFRKALQSGQSVTAAIYVAGFGSSSRAYQGAACRLGMRPSAYRNGAMGERIRYASAPCSLGWVLVAATPRGVCAIELGDDPGDLALRLRRGFPKAEMEEGDPPLAAWVEQVVAFIDALGRPLDLPLDIHGTAFQQRVWRALQDIPPGGTASYAEIAKRMGQPNAARAVARACAANPVALAIPCHRAVGAGGGLRGYRWGVERKRTLLEGEKAVSTVPSRD